MLSRVLNKSRYVSPRFRNSSTRFSADLFAACEGLWLAHDEPLQGSRKGDDVVHALSDVRRQLRHRILQEAGELLLAFVRALFRLLTLCIHQQGFSKEIKLDRSVWAGYIKDYEGGTIMHVSDCRPRSPASRKLTLKRNVAVLDASSCEVSRRRRDAR